MKIIKPNIAQGVKRISLRLYLSVMIREATGILSSSSLGMGEEKQSDNRWVVLVSHEVWGMIPLPPKIPLAVFGILQIAEVQNLDRNRCF